MYQQLWGYKVEEKLYLGVREQKRLNTTALEHSHLVSQQEELHKGNDEFGITKYLCSYLEEIFNMP
jgi:hypothetical protein